MHQFILKPKCTNMFFNFNQMGKLNMKIYEFMKNKECKLIQLTVTNNKWQNHCSIIYSYHLVTFQIIDLSQKVNNFHNLIFSYFDLRINRKLEIKDNFCAKNLWMIILFSNMYYSLFLATRFVITARWTWPFSANTIWTTTSTALSSRFTGTSALACIALTTIFLLATSRASGSTNAGTAFAAIPASSAFSRCYCNGFLKQGNEKRY